MSVSTQHKVGLLRNCVFTSNRAPLPHLVRLTTGQESYAYFLVHWFTLTPDFVLLWMETEGVKLCNRVKF